MEFSWTNHGILFLIKPVSFSFAKNKRMQTCTLLNIYILYTHTRYPDTTNVVGDNHRGCIKNKAAKKSNYLFFLIWTAVARVDFQSLSIGRKETVFFIFSKSWFLKLPGKGMESCKTLKVMSE